MSILTSLRFWLNLAILLILLVFLGMVVKSSDEITNSDLLSWACIYSAVLTLYCLGFARFNPSYQSTATLPQNLKRLTKETALWVIIAIAALTATLMGSSPFFSLQSILILAGVCGQTVSLLLFFLIVFRYVDSEKYGAVNAISIFSNNLVIFLLTLQPDHPNVLLKWIPLNTLFYALI